MICDDVLDQLSEKIDEMEAGRLAIINKLIALDSWDNPSIKTYTLTEIPDHIKVEIDITVVANPTAGGTVSGGGKKTVGTKAYITAIPNLNYKFTGWDK